MYADIGWYGQNTMTLLASQFSSLFENIRNAQSTEALQAKFARLLGELKPLIAKEPVRTFDLSEDALKAFLAEFQAADSLGKIQRARNPPGMIFWNALGFGRDEVANCRILHWLLDPSADHHQGNRFFACLLQLAPLKHLSHYSDQKICVSREEWLDETNRADLVIHGNDFNVVIEAKINSAERQNQRVNYRDRAIQNYPWKVFSGIFLTTRNNHSETPGWISLTWLEISEALRMFISEDNHYRCENGFIRELAEQYRKYIITTMSN